MQALQCMYAYVLLLIMPVVMRQLLETMMEFICAKLLHFAYSYLTQTPQLMAYATILYFIPFRSHCTDNLSMPADIIKEGKLSALQLEAIVYGCQRHQQHLPAADPKRTFVAPSNNDKKKKKSKTALKDNTTANQTFPAIKAEKKKGAAGAATSDAPTPNDVPPKPTVGYRKGFLVGDGAGMGKGRTLAGFVLENNAVGRKRHIWVSVSSDLYDDAKRGKSYYRHWLRSRGLLIYDMRLGQSSSHPHPPHRC